MEYALEVWNPHVGEWHILDTSTTREGLDTSIFDGSDDRWRIVKTEVIESHG